VGTATDGSGAFVIGPGLRAVELPGVRLQDARFSPDHTRVATVALDGSARVWTRDGAPLARTEHGGPLMTLAWAPTGASVALASADGSITLWRPDDDAKIGPVAAHANIIPSIGFSADGELLATTSAAHAIKVWETHSLH